MRHRDAVALLEGAVPRRAGTWADLGAGDGTFTRAIAELAGEGSTVYAVDRDASALGALPGGSGMAGVRLIPVHADITGAFELPGLGRHALDGVLLANTLHFLAEPAAVLERLARRLAPGGRMVIVEYDRRGASRWVPHPIPSARWPELAAAAGLSAPAVLRRRPSTFGGELYVAVAER